MNVVIRTDASVDIGVGHVMRCMTLADQLIEVGGQVQLICADLPGAMFDLIRARDYRYEQLSLTSDTSEEDAAATKRTLQESCPEGVDWLIVDHYGLDEQWENALRPYVNYIMVIDDLANRRHDCDLLLDQNYYRNLDTRYDGLVNASTVKLLGPQYVLLRPEFYRARRDLRKRTGIVRRILNSFGGSDPSNQTECALRAIDKLKRPDIKVDVVVGSSNPNQESIRSYCEKKKWANYYCQISNMEELVLSADFAIGAGGSAMWERCALGLPTLTVVFAENQVQTTEDVARTGAISYFGSVNDLTSDNYAEAVGKLISSPEKLLTISNNAVSLIDMRSSGAEKIMNAMSTIENRSAYKLRI